MVATCLPDGSLLLVSPIAPTAEALSLLAGLGGRVSHIVLPSSSPEHWFYGPALSNAFPDATVWVVPGLLEGKGLPVPFLGQMTASMRPRCKALGVDQLPAELQGQVESELLTAPFFIEAAVVLPQHGALLLADTGFKLDAAEYGYISSGNIAAAEKAGVWDRLGPITRIVFEKYPKEGRACAAASPLLIGPYCPIAAPAMAARPSPSLAPGLCLLLALSLLALSAGAQPQPGSRSPSFNGYVLLWNDTFTGPLNTNNWKVMTGDGSALKAKGWLDGEKQVYATNNAVTYKGALALKATQTQSGIASGRIHSKKFWMPRTESGQYNILRFETRFKVPAGSGLRARIFLLPAAGFNSTCVGCGAYGIWPASGEVDLLDVSNNMADVKGGAAFGGVKPNNRYVGATWHYEKQNPTDWHVLIVEWEPTKMTWYLDGQPRYQLVSGKGTGAGWFTNARGSGLNGPFDRFFYIGLSLSAGGITAGNHNLAQLRTSIGAGKNFFVDYINVWGRKVPGGRPMSKPTVAAVVKPAAVSLPVFNAKDWTLAWSDEFNGNGVTGKDWDAQLGDGAKPENWGTGPGWGNKEEQYYVDDKKNLDVVKHKFDTVRGDPKAPNNDGFMKISAFNDGGVIKSARVRSTISTLSWAPTAANPVVRISARVNLPAGKGLWGMMWLLPSGAACSANTSGCGRYGGWPASGEIDIVSSINDMMTVQGNQHYGGQFPTDVHVESNVQSPTGKSFANEWHTWSLEWSLDGTMVWKLDDDTDKGTVYFFAQSGDGSPLGWYTRGTGDTILGGDAPFAGQTFHLIFNLAVGGVHSGVDRATCLETTKTEKYMMVDWVRVYTKKKA
ncbi:glucan endo-1,3-beta-D-glucosidase [Chlorella sorokiniana]|uniref:Glucan endo-1,3-beta-D-glucosidase n=1 Tax=Chlorella sorokiniana TaxID=3076 RepID=A0A2P6TPQ3_CHLSO|nr:glucan endo-1,3-beta-D-glucosidase [Chlorella sorokiniana]|eukprot:PRW55989.1 glucan endo-1,3-beta-D-glucosidase [Chlorella sorokiniana]